MTKRKIIIDTDPGVDDTMAILLALQAGQFDIMGLTTVFGNTSVEKTTRNALKILELAGHPEIPVAMGADRPLAMENPGYAEFVHGADGLGNNKFPEPTIEKIDTSAVQFIIENIMRHPGEITLVPLGPLTNIALAMRVEPRIIERVKEVVLMGGSARGVGNASPVAEANIRHDPHAAQQVFRAEWKLTMVGLDVTEKTVMDKAFLESMLEQNHPYAKIIREVMPFYLNFNGGNTIYVHDPSAITYLMHPEFYKTEQHPVFVETEGRCKGQTVPDKNRLWIDWPEQHICLDVDGTAVIENYRDTVLKPVNI
jgi:uridine nucleosidase